MSGYVMFIWLVEETLIYQKHILSYNTSIIKILPYDIYGNATKF